MKEENGFKNFYKCMSFVMYQKIFHLFIKKIKLNKTNKTKIQRGKKLHPKMVKKEKRMIFKSFLMSMIKMVLPKEF
jgi:hypothetical protein